MIQIAGESIYGEAGARVPLYSTSYAIGFFQRRGHQRCHAVVVLLVHRRAVGDAPADGILLVVHRGAVLHARTGGQAAARRALSGSPAAGIAGGQRRGAATGARVARGAHQRRVAGVILDVDRHALSPRARPALCTDTAAA